MAEISEYQRQNLKSSVVGTAGIDTSMAQAVDSVGRNVARVGDAAFDLAVKRKQAKDLAIANESILAMDVDMENTLRNHQEAHRDFEGAPSERASIFQSIAEKQVQERARMAPNDEVRRAILDQGMSMIRSRTEREIRAADANQGVIALSKINNAQKISEEEAARVGSDENMDFNAKIMRLDELLNRSQGTLKASSVVLDPVQAQQLSVESPAGILKAAATGMIAKRPEELLALLGRKGANGKSIFEGRLAPAEIEKLKKEATDSLANFKERQQREQLEANFMEVADTFTLAKNGDSVGALAKTESLPDGALKTAMRQSILREGLTEADRSQKVVDLTTKFATLMADRDRNTKGRGGKKKTNMKASLDELLQFQSEVVEAHALGDITDATRNKYLTEFLPELHSKVKKNSMAIEAMVPDSEASWVAKTWAGITGVTKDPDEAVTIQQDFRRRLVQGNDFSPAGANKALLGALDEHRRNRFPSSIFLADSVNAVKARNKSLIATGVQGQTGADVTAKIPGVARTAIGTDSEGNKFKVYFDSQNKEIKREKMSNA